MMATEGLGAFLGSLGLATFVRPTWYRPAFIAGATGFLGMVFLFSLSTWYAASLPVLLLAGLGVSGFAAMQGTLLMHGTPPEMRSRVMGLLTLAIGAAPFGILLVGALSEWLGPSPRPHRHLPHRAHRPRRRGPRLARVPPGDAAALNRPAASRYTTKRRRTRATET